MLTRVGLLGAEDVHDAPIFGNDLDRLVENLAVGLILVGYGLGRGCAGNPICISGVKVDLVA